MGEMLRQIMVPLLIVISGVFCLEFMIPISLGEFFVGIIGGIFFDTEDIPWLKFFSHLGLLAIMFLAGFEIDVGVLKKNLGKNVAIGALSFLTPFVGIGLVALVVGLPLEQAFVMGVALSTTSLAIVFSVLRQADALASEKGQLLLGAAMVVDLLSAFALVLAFVEFTLYNLVFFVALIVFLVLAKKIIVSIFERYRGNRFEFELKFLLLILLALGLVADEAGVHSAIIAFVLGVILSDIDREHNEIILRLNSVVYSLLAPIFFFHAGMSLSFSNFELGTFVMLFLFSIAALGGKYWGTSFAFRKFYGPDVELAQYAGIIFNYRLSFGIVAAIYSLEKGIIGPQLYNVILLVIALSSVFSVVSQYRRKVHEGHWLGKTDAS